MGRKFVEMEEGVVGVWPNVGSGYALGVTARD